MEIGKNHGIFGAFYLGSSAQNEKFCATGIVGALEVSVPEVP